MQARSPVENPDVTIQNPELHRTRDPFIQIARQRPQNGNRKSKRARPTQRLAGHPEPTFLGQIRAELVGLALGLDTTPLAQALAEQARFLGQLITDALLVLAQLVIGRLHLFLHAGGGYGHRRVQPAAFDRGRHGIDEALSEGWPRSCVVVSTGGARGRIERFGGHRW
jgi:hypothetical protein